MKAWTYEADKLLFSNLKDLKGFISHFYHNFLIYPNYHHINIIMIWTLYINVPLYLVFRIFKFSLFSEFRLNIYIFRSESSSDLLCSYYSTVYYVIFVFKDYFGFDTLFPFFPLSPKLILLLPFLCYNHIISIC